MEPPYNRGYLCSGRGRANKKLPLPDFECEDSLFWPFTYNGIYNSKTGYRFLKAEGAPDGNEDHVELDKALWRGIWSLQILNKMKNLTWRACQYLLRTKQNLVCRTIIDSPLCDRCKLEPKQLFMPSGHAANWTSCGKMGLIGLVEGPPCTFMDFKELLSWMIKNQQSIELFSITAWTT